MKRKIQLVIFDLDGTLINAYPAVRESVNVTLKALGLKPVTTQTIKRTVGWGEGHLIQTFVGEKNLAKALRIYRRHHKQALTSGTKLLPGAKRILKYLKKEKYLVAVASNRATKFSRILIRHLNIDGYFDYILCRDKVRRPKPFPDILRGILRKFSLKPCQALFVGDMVLDVEAGQRAKVKTVAVLTGSSTRKEMAAFKPFRIVRHVSDVAGILQRLNARPGPGNG